MKKMRVTVLSIILVLLLSACAKAAATPDAGYSLETSGGAARNSSAAPSPIEMPAVSGKAQGVNGSPDISASTVQTTDQMVIMNSDLVLAVDDPSVSLAAIQKLAADMGGFTVSSNLYKTQTSSGVEVPEANVTVRIPADRLNEALDKIKAMTGDPKKYVLTENVTGQDVTQAYTDLQSRLKNLEEAEAELTKFYESATKTEDILAIYNQKQSISQQIEVLKGQIQYYEQASAKSLISINLKAKSTIAPIAVAGWEPKGIARDALQALVEAGKGIVNVLIWVVLFVLPIALVIGVPLYFLIRWLKRRSAKRRMPGQIPPIPPAQ
jgi:tellurite resistance-related uncharacterized protein